VMSKVLKEPTGTEQQPAAWAPKVTETDGLPSGLEFGDTEAPDGLQVTTLIEGEGAALKKGDVIFVNYLGQVPGADQPFDASYGREPFSFPLGAGQVVEGWDQALPGVTVGSRIIVAIPPELGYKAKGKPEAGIKGTDTMYFVVDVLGAG
jgi:peptidylprolyl isomerase